MTDDEIEEVIKEKGLDAPRLTPKDIEGVIASEDFHVLPGTTITVCVLTLKNGFRVTGESMCVSADNFDKEVGRSIARDNAVSKVWELEGYLLTESLYNRGK